MSNVVDLSEARRQAWVTRRAKYGPAGHRGVSITYKRTATEPTPAAHIEEARDWTAARGGRAR